MEEEPRSLWEVYDSEVEPWRRGRVLLVAIGLLYFVVQAYAVAAETLAGNVERILILGSGAVFFWLLFYFVWIGVHWLRFIWGGWNMLLGFCFLIWSWRDENGIEVISGMLHLLIGFYLCFSPSIYFFTSRQHGVSHWRESLLFGFVSFLLLLAIGGAILVLSLFRFQQAREACAFADEANQRIYHDWDMDWVVGHVTPASFQENGKERLRYFFQSNRQQLGSVGAISLTQARLRLHFQLPFDLRADALVDGQAETENGPIELHAVLLDNGVGWALDRMWWTYLPKP